MTRHTTARCWWMAVVLVCLVGPSLARAQQPPDDIRTVIEGTWELIEWHVDGRILRQPEMDGRWMVHDGLVMAIRHRDGSQGFESTAGYGAYRWGASTWTYGYRRSEDLRGPSAADATLRVTDSNPIPMRTFEISREGDHLILEDADRVLRWDYDIPGKTFLLMNGNREVIRKYRKVP